MTPLEQSMTDFVSANNVLHIEIIFNRMHDDASHTWFSTSTQWLDAQGERGIALGNGDTIAEAMSRMMDVLAAKRGHVAIDTSEALEVVA